MTLWAAYLLLAPTVGLGWIDSWHNEQRAAQVVLLIASVLVYVLTALARPGTVSSIGSVSAFPGWLLALFAIGVVSALRCDQILAGLAEVSLLVLLGVLTLQTAAAVSIDIDRASRWTRWFAVLYAGAYVLGVATRYLAAVNLGRSIDLDVLILGYANPRFPSAFHALLIPFLVATAADRYERRWLRATALCTLALLWAINLGLGTRGIWFAYAVGIPLSIFLLGWSSLKRFTAVFGLSCLAGIGLYLVLFHGVTALAGSGSAVSSPVENLSTVTSREVLWELSWKAISSSPVLGIGPMQFATYGSHVGAHPHNWVLQVAGEWGLVSLVLLLGGLYSLAKAVRSATSERLTVAPTVAVLAALALGLVDGNLVMPISQSGFFLALGLLIGTTYNGDSKVGLSEAPRVRLVLTWMVGSVACVVLATYAAASLGGQPAEIALFRKLHPGAWLVPRFWEQGSL